MLIEIISKSFRQLLFDAQHYLSMLSLSSPSFDANYDGVFGSPSSSIGVPSSSTRAPSFYLTNASWFASYF
jgi:hypothetical protein